MKVSIIIPCFRQGKYLTEAVDSCLGQTYQPIEVIVVNDGSDDDTDEVASSYKDAITYIRKKNGGVSSARNVGISAATGRYMMFMDADDHLVPHKLDWHVQGIASRAHCVSMTTLRAYEHGHPERFHDIIPEFQHIL